jgi:bifunctional non-homologous end joining protein LigD
MTTISKIEITNPDKIYYPKLGITKLQVVQYYKNIVSKILPFLYNRPLTLERYPDGIHKEGFYQKSASDYFPSFVKTEKIETEDGNINQVVCNTKRTLIYLVNQGTISFHIWNSKISMINKPNKVVFDLDPSENDFERVKKAAEILKEFLHQREIEPHLMTTGKNGLHVWYKIRRTKTFDEVREETKILAKKLEKEHPELLTTSVRKEKRKGKVFIDYLRNSYGQTSICPYSLRPNKSAGIATPISWSALKNLKSADFYNINNIKT